MRKLLSFLCVVAVASWLGSDRPRAQGAGAPILVVTQDSATANPFDSYLPEILRAEGINSFNTLDLESVDAGALTNVRLVILPEIPISPGSGAGQADTFINFVNGGGRLIAMRPDSDLYTVLGISAGGGSTTNGYTLIDQAGPGAGLQNVTLPFRGVADHYTLGTATRVAELYTDRTTSAARPAVVRTARTAAWAFDLALSTAFTRQGNPADAAAGDADADGTIRTNDIFFGPGKLDLDRVGTPHADVQMRLFTRVVNALLEDVQPLPRLWYFPGVNKSVMVATGDAHFATSPFDALLSHLSTSSTIEGVAPRMSIYFARYIDTTGLSIAAWRTAGHELGMHPYFQGEDPPFPAPAAPDYFSRGYDIAEEWFLGPIGPGLPIGPTARHHRVEWRGWVDPVPAMVDSGVRMDLSYYTWGRPMFITPGNPADQAHGFITGSGLPMKFVNASGGVQNVYQQVTSIVDEQLVNLGSAFDSSQNLDAPAALAVSQQMIDASLNGGYSAIATQFHVDHYLNFPQNKVWVDGTIDYARQRMPIMTTQRWLAFTEARAATTISNLSWTPATGLFAFTITVPAGAEAQPLMLPASFAGNPLARIRIDNQLVVPLPMTANGQAVYVVPVGPGARQVSVRYVPAGTAALSIADASGVEGNAGTAVVNLTVTLSQVAADDVSVTYSTSNGSATAPADYQSITGSVVIPEGATSGQAAVTINGDSSIEGNETVIVTLSNPLGAALGDSTATLTIVDDEPIVSVGDAYNTPYLTPLVIAAPGVLANDNAQGSPTMVAILTANVSNGTLSLAGTGGFSYTPNAGFVGVDSFSYRAETAVGPGNPVAVTITVAAPTTVQPPTGLRVSAMAGNLVTFRWNAPAIGPAAAGYLLEGGVVPAQPMVSLPTGLAAPILDIAAPSGSFYVRIRTLGAGGPSAPSNEILAHIGVPAPPSPPTGLQAISVGNTVHLAWTPTFGGGAPGGFVLDVGGTLAAAIPLPNLERVSFAGAPSGAYTLSLRAVNAGGSSAPGAAVPLAVPDACAGPPGPPTNLLAYVNAGTTFVVWDPPASGSPPTSYVVTVPGIGALPLAQRTISGPLPARHLVDQRAGHRPLRRERTGHADSLRALTPTSDRDC